jgi:hypothetical protein
LPIVLFDESDDDHWALADLGAAAEDAARAVELQPDVEFKRGRGMIRQRLEEIGLAGHIDELVELLLGKYSKR